MIWAFPIVLAAYVFFYHYERNGNPLNLGNTICRILWALMFSLGYMVMSGDDLKWFVGLYFAVAAFVEILVPHAFAQNMGRWATPWKVQGLKKYWPGCWLPQYSQFEWDNLSDTKKTVLDFMGMASVGFLRGFIVFGLPSLLGWLSMGGYVAWAITLAWHPLSYLAGRFTPWDKWDNHPYSTEWGEFYVPIGWAISVAVAILCS